MSQMVIDVTLSKPVPPAGPAPARINFRISCGSSCAIACAMQPKPVGRLITHCSSERSPLALGGLSRMTRTIDFYFDFPSPYSYLAHTQLPRIPAEHALAVAFPPF